MKTTMLIILALFFIAGCGHVAGNYPTTASAQVTTELPLSWVWKEKEQPALWERAGHSKVFFAQWDDLRITLTKAEYVADKGNILAQREAKEISELVKQNLAMARVALFYISDEPLTLRRSELEITFDNGDVVKDQGVLFWEEEKAFAKKHNSRTETLHINNKWRKAGEALHLCILVPNKYLNTKIQSINFTTLQ